MKYAWNRIFMVTLGAGLLWGGLALAKSPQQKERENTHDSCLGACKEDVNTCSTACKKHAREGASLCIKACKDLQNECEQDCKAPGGK
ncbi:hypothetical protein [Hyalangium versicolor]|uniref:hypothetical protein n=1 Tax=Hyalangium versicolor TaxID=2861190 RepID=UPI001CCAE3C2|nr:hypothetical protein [Hyalangium versicolor]